MENTAHDTAAPLAVAPNGNLRAGGYRRKTMRHSNGSCTVRLSPVSRRTPLRRLWMPKLTVVWARPRILREMT